MIVPFDPAHCEGARAHLSLARYQYMFDDPSCFEVLWPATYSAIHEDGLVAIGGAPVIDGMAGGWVLFTDKITPGRFVEIHRAVARFIAENEAFAHLDPSNPAAMRWAGLLGMKAQRTEALADGHEMLRADNHER